MNEAIMQISGPAQKPAHGGEADQLVILVHGYGADGDDLIGLAPILSRVLPGAAFVSPHAPYPCDGAPFGRQWFGIYGADDAMRLAGARNAARILDAFIDEQLLEHGLDDSRLLLIGFSQGTMMSLHVGLRRSKQPAGIIGFSGRLIAPELLESEMTVRPPISLIHGDCDEMVPVESMPAAEKALSAAGLSVETQICQGLGHGIDETGLRRALAFITRIFPQ